MTILWHRQVWKCELRGYFASLGTGWLGGRLRKLVGEFEFGGYEAPGVPGFAFDYVCEEGVGFGGLIVEEVPVADAVADGVEGEGGFGVAGGGWGWEDGFGGDFALVEVEELEVEEEVGFGVFDVGGDAGEDLGGFRLHAGAGVGVVEPGGAVDQAVVRVGGFGGEVARAGEVGGGGVEVALEVEGEAEVVVAVEGVGGEVDGALEIGLGAGELAEAEFAVAALEVKGGVGGVGGDGGGVGGDGFGVLAAAGLGERKFEGEGGVGGVGGEGLAGFRDGAVVGRA